MGLAGVLTTEVSVEPPDRLAEVHAFLSGQGPVDPAQLAAMRHHVSAITIRRASTGSDAILACVLVIEPCCHGRSLIFAPVTMPNFFIVGQVHVCGSLAAFRAEAQETLIAAAIMLVETSLGNRNDRGPSGIVMLQDDDRPGAELLKRLSAYPLNGQVSGLLGPMERQLGLTRSKPAEAWVIRSASLQGSAAMSLSTGAIAMFPGRRQNPLTNRFEMLSVRDRLPTSGALRPQVERLARGELDQEWRAPPLDVLLPVARRALDRRG